VAPRFMKHTQMYPMTNTGVGTPPNVANEELSLRPPSNTIIKRMPPMPYKGNAFGPTMNDTGRMNQPSPPMPMMIPMSEPVIPDSNKDVVDKKKKDKVRRFKRIISLIS
jgi:hypothetical protein